MFRRGRREDVMGMPVNKDQYGKSDIQGRNRELINALELDGEQISKNRRLDQKNHNCPFCCPFDASLITSQSTSHVSLHWECCKTGNATQNVKLDVEEVKVLLVELLSML